MPSKKQIAWRKKFARMSKAGKFKKSKKSSSTPKKSNSHNSSPKGLKGKWIIFYDEGNYEDVEFPRVKRMGLKDVIKEINTYKKWLRYEKVFARDPDEIKVIDYYLSQT
tara:strand:+ start:196 stop:522 length:327 start_codon:yes stop_codon:yes gene_type:complete